MRRLQLYAKAHIESIGRLRLILLTLECEALGLMKSLVVFYVCRKNVQVRAME